MRIEAGIYAKKSFSQIAKEIGRSTSSIVREVKQNRLVIKSPHTLGKECQICMKRYSELLYWMDYMHLIHFDEKKNKYYCNPELPLRARKSFLNWIAQENGKSNILKKLYYRIIVVHTRKK